MSIDVSKAEKVNVDSVRVEIELCHDGDSTRWTRVYVKWTCPSCAGHGCRFAGRDSKCLNGMIHNKLDDLSGLERFVDADTATSIRDSLRGIVG